MRVRFYPEARLDFKNAAAHYAAIRPSLGHGFYRHTDRLIAEIAADPTLFRVYRLPQARRHFRRPFPYAIVNVVRPDEVFIVAVMHFEQPPNYWRRRFG